MRYLVILFFGLMLLSCREDENCATDDSREFVVLRFYDLETKAVKSVGFRFIVDDSPYAWRFLADTTITIADTTIVNSDTTIVPADTTIVSDSTFVLLPLNPNDSSVIYRFTSDTSNHLLELRYDVSYSIYDPSCVPSLLFINIDTVRQTFDSTIVVGPATIRQLDTNVEIYL